MLSGFWDSQHWDLQHLQHLQMALAVRRHLLIGFMMVEKCS